MTIEKPMRYVIFGAGAIGSAIAGLLVRAGSRVICVARPAYAEALRRGIVIREDTGELAVKIDAVTAARELSPERSDIALITTKSQGTDAAVAELLERYDQTLPVVCLQNGVRNEEIAGRRFQNVYAGLVFLSAVQLEPSVIALPQGRSVAIGCYPAGVDNIASDLCAELCSAGFEAMSSAYVMSMKWGKLVANLNNATTTITGYWLERAMSDPRMRSLMLAVREEGLRVLDAAGIAVEPPADEPSPIRIREMTDKLREPPKHPYDPAKLSQGPRTYSSMWQDLHLGRKSHEAEFLNGDIVAIGARLGVPTPYNSSLLRIVNRMFDEGLSPGLYDPDELNALIASQAAGS
jgi:2-dehydropantoate 2-reductase